MAENITQNLCSQPPVLITTFFREKCRLVQEEIKIFFHIQLFLNISIESNRKEKIKKFKIMENNTEIRKTETLHIRLTPDDKQLIEQYAKMMNFSMSAFIEILIHRKRIIVCENLGELIIQLSRIGNNINQIAHTANSAKTISNEQIEKVQELMNQVYDQMTRFVDLLIEKDSNLPKSIGIHTGKAISNLADAVRRLEKRMEQIEEKL